MKIFIFLIVTFNAFTKEIYLESKSLITKYTNEAKTENLKGGIRFSYCPDNTCDLLDFQTKDEKVVWDAGLIFLLYKSTYATLDDFKKKESIKLFTLKLQKKYNISCEKNSSIGNCLNNFFVKKYNMKQSFARYDEGKLKVERLL